MEPASIHDEKKEEIIVTPHSTPTRPQSKAHPTTPTALLLESRKGLLKALLQHNLKNKFSSTPIADTDDDTSALMMSRSGEHAAPAAGGDPAATLPSLTESERSYLESLLKAGDPNSIHLATQKLQDPSLFPRQHQLQSSDVELYADPKYSASSSPPSLSRRRDSKIQQHLFRLHETQAVKPSLALQKMTLVHRNSLLESSDELDVSNNSSLLLGEGNIIQEANSPSLETKEGDAQRPTSPMSVNSTRSSGSLEYDWNPFKDVSSWLDGSEGVEVDDCGEPLPKQLALLKSPAPFRILGTSADDVSCHPHVMSPPLMESLSAFVPESVASWNFWLKYSLVRDGGGLYKLLRHIRASMNCFLAIETEDGHVFGAFTAESWRYSHGWYGKKDTFLWKMRRSRLETTRSIVEQACQEGEIQVYPYRPGQAAVQYCDTACLMLGQGELLPANDKTGDHYGHALYLESALTKGTTSTSETFGNPCLVDDQQRGATFRVANLEVWTLTPHTTVEESEQWELSYLFLEGGRDTNERNLDIMRILVGGPI